MSLQNPWSGPGFCDPEDDQSNWHHFQTEHGGEKPSIPNGSGAAVEAWPWPWDTGVPSWFHLFSEYGKYRLCLKTGRPMIQMYRTGTFSETHFPLGVAIFIRQNEPSRVVFFIYFSHW